MKLSHRITGDGMSVMRNLDANYRSAIDSAISKWSKSQRSALKRFGYPPQRHASQPFRSDRQRRWFFWALSSGVINVPYRRTGRLANSWSAKKRGWADWLLVNSASYASLVIGEDSQAGYHRGWWWTANSVIEQDIKAAEVGIVNEIEGVAR